MFFAREPPIIGVNFATKYIASKKSTVEKIEEVQKINNNLIPNF